jgi:hypothetical protein
MFSLVKNENPILNPTLWIGNFEWREPVTTLTDLVTAFVCLYAFIQFKKYKGRKSTSFTNYKYYFFFFFISMASAGCFGHGLQAYIGFDWKKIGWVMSSIGFLNIEFGSIKELENKLKPSIIKLFKTTFIIQFIVFVSLMIYYQNFKIPQLNSTVTFILFVLPLQILAYAKSKDKSHLIILGTIVFALIPGLVYNNQLSFGKWFNYHDISHILMATFMFFMFKGTFKLSTTKR